MDAVASTVAAEADLGGALRGCDCDERDEDEDERRSIGTLFAVSIAAAVSNEGTLFSMNESTRAGAGGSGEGAR
jgi:hypothetical protein